MLLKTKPKKSIPRQGPQRTKLASVTGKPDAIAPKKVIFGFRFPGYDGEVCKESPASFEEGAPLRIDVETLQGRQLTADEAAKGLDLTTLIGVECEVVIAHKSGAGGKPVPVVSVIQPVPQGSLPLSE